MCEQAVTRSDGDPGSRASRGLARALTGDRSGAIEDFQAALDPGDGFSEEYIALFRQWIADLQAGKDPFTPEVLEELRN